MATVVTDQNFQEEVLNANMLVLVDFFAEWCGPCKMIAPIIEELATEYEGKAKIVKLDVDMSPVAAQKFGVMSIPTLTFIKNGVEVDRVTGALPKDMLAEKLNSLL